ncbi:transcription termination/antitermination protein NusG [Frigoribacterium sp. CFBP9039]|uniref:transcription termination/antitermination protein NusG n=1 Tax=Frigoribacterium TaxID=96492 RepID=UPI001FAB494C|nr:MULTISPECIES: transcription termination/antitermination protein NusG [Frigoribacterium]MCJ0700774.1 transcription termination/antitermination protein NusG [Frigoribacterium faeni]MDY0892051.1 transcription termination/antitermination protein NusG [Frigoribacterium sp. CFBP9030]MDY0946149.1 transcription termination/antitermination protein NusG [Frigoribacterium sp. CFBP9039]
MPDNERDDIDLATAAEQSSEVEEAQEGGTLAADEDSVEPAESEAITVVDDGEAGTDSTDDLDGLLDTLAEARDPEADAIVDDALDIDDAAEAEAAVEATDDEAETEAEDAAVESDTVVTADADVEIDSSSDDVVVAEAEQSVQDADAQAAFGDEVLDGDDVATDDEAEPVEVDPYEEFRSELRGKPGKWYVIHSYAGFERRVKQNIENRMVSMTMEDYIYQVEVPMEDVVEIKNGQRKLVTRVRIPGYVLVRIDLNEDSWSVVRHTPGVTGFVGNAHNPTPLRFEEAFNMLKSLVQIDTTPAPVKGGAKGGKQAQRVIPAEVDFEIGETITIKEGSFAGLPGTINEIKPESGKLTVLVSLFERETPVELSFDQVTKL